jgi:alpha-tubulin suppressor-like RCC1 family protein
VTPLANVSAGESFNARKRGRLFSALVATGVAFAAGCGGGGGGDAPAPAPAPPPPAAAPPTASLVTPVSGKTPWNLETAAQFSLKDGLGNPVAGTLSCVSDVPTTLVVAADCSSINGKRLGVQSITVTSGSVSAKTTVRVIPQPHPIASHGPASSFGGQFNMVTTTDGRVLAWGSNSGGVLGQGMTAAQLVSLALPTAVKDPTGQASLTGVVAVSIGAKTALALTEDGEVYSWGDNIQGVLGRTAPNGDPLPGKVVGPTGTGTLQHIVSVSIGDQNAVALADDGTVYSWGYYTGRSGADPKLAPGPVNAVSGGGALSDAVAVSAGWNWSAALLADGRIVTWGFSSNQSLGRPGVAQPIDAPGYVIDLLTSQPLTTAVSLSAGYAFGMALNAAGQVYAWGDDQYGQIGQNTSLTDYLGAALVKAPGGAGLLSDITMVAAGGHHALALDSSGRVLSWGYSQDGQLGDGASHPRVNFSSLPDAVVSLAGTGQLADITAIAAGFSHSLALTNDGSLLIWGHGFRGNLGQGIATQPNSFVPLVVKNEAGTGDLSLGPITYWPNPKQRGR